MEYRFSEAKNHILAVSRGVSFDDVIAAIAESGILMEYENPNQEKYPGQRIMVVRINDYTYCVPFSVDGDVVHLKTVYPNRRFRHLLEGDS
jgi:uncharacterized DUF497 family protein